MSLSKTSDVSQETHFHERTIHFDGAEVVAFRGYTNDGKPWQPNRAHAKWRHGKPIEEIVVHGRFIKKDGTPGVNLGRRVYLTPASGWYEREPGRSVPPSLYYLFADSPHGGGDYAPPQQP